jgi:hypothetical protein
MRLRVVEVIVGYSLKKRQCVIASQVIRSIVIFTILWLWSFYEKLRAIVLDLRAVLCAGGALCLSLNWLPAGRFVV